MTEDEAKKKWCPYVSQVAQTPAMAGHTECLASECMMFRWIPDFAINISKGLTAFVDKEDELLIKKYKWWWDGRYIKQDKEPGEKYLHRLIASEHYGEIPIDMVVDHIDGNPLNNRLGNLRICTQAENIANSKSRGGKSKYRGVSLSRTGRWYAQISKGGFRECLGTFDSEEDAATAYDEAAKRIHGEFANLNLVSENNIGRRGYCGLAGKP